MEDDNIPPPPPPPPPPPSFEEVEFIRDQDHQNFDSNNGYLDENDDAPITMPEPWERHYSEEDQAYYYYHPETEQCIWETTLLMELSQHNQQQESQDDDYEQQYDTQQQQQREEDQQLNLNDLADLDFNNDNDDRYTDSERSKLTQEAKQRKISALQQQKQRNELASITSQPQINKKSQGLQRSVEDMCHWEQNRQEKLQLKTAKLRAEEDKNLTGKPNVIAYHSHNNINNNQNNSVRSVTERLYAYETQKQWKLQQKQLLQQKAIKDLANKPKINAISVRYQHPNDDKSSNKNVVERLYALSKLRNVGNEGENSEYSLQDNV